MLHDPWNKPGGNDTGAVSGFGIDIRDFGSVKGSNARDTFDKALAGAYVAASAPDNGQDGTPCLLVPGGKYSMGNTPMVFPGNLPNYTPGMVGLGGPGNVILEWTNTVGGPWITTGSETPGAGGANATQFQVFQNLELRCEGGASAYGGIKSRFGFMQRFTDVLVRGLTAQDQPWDAGTAFDFRNSSEPSSNHQHLRLERCYSFFSQIGFWFGDAVWSCTASDVHANGSTVAGSLFESGAVVTWTGGNTQCGPSAVNTNHWNAGTRQAVHCSGATYTTGLPSGVGASMGVASGQFTTLTNLGGLTGYLYSQSSSNKGMWIECRKTVSPFTGNDRISGLYRIHQVLSATSCVIRKASDHAANVGGITWQVRGGGGGYNTTLNGIYHEGGAYALASFGPDIVSSSRFRFLGCEANNTDVVIEASGVTGEPFIQGTPSPGGTSGLLRRCSNFATDSRITSVDMDSYSRAGVRAVAVSTGSENRPARLWDAGPRSGRYNSALVERGFVFGLDARKSSSFAKTGASITTWTDFIGNKVGARINAGVAPQYVAADTGFLGPAVQLTGGASAAAVGGFTFDVTSLLTSGRDIEPTLIVVGRLPNTTLSTGDHTVRLTQSTNYSLETHWNDNVRPGFSYSVVYSIPTSALTGGALLPVDTLPHVMISAAHCSGRGAAGGGSDATAWATAASAGGYAPISFVGGLTANVTLGEWVGGTIADLIVEHVALAPFGITDEERGYFIDLARNEFNITE